VDRHVDTRTHEHVYSWNDVSDKTNGND
jgi:hypothetical protein